jgi:putative heme iron utilization protein
LRASESTSLGVSALVFESEDLAMPTDAHAKVATPSHAEQARTLAARVETGTLCTNCPDPVGYPYGSLVTVSFYDGHPLFFLSEVAEHTKHLRLDPRASLLIAEGGEGDPLAHGRVTLLGECTLVANEEPAAKVFLEQHPYAEMYADFHVFAYWRMNVISVRHIAGFGKMSWVSASEWLAAEPDPLGPHAAGIIKRMNQSHRDALSLYCRAFSQGTGVTNATMTAIDRYGFEMSAMTPEGARSIRLGFAEPICTPTEARKQLVSMLREARLKLGTIAGA